MMRLDKIYTRGGDAGETSLGDGKRVAKHSLRVAAYGTVDEANAVLGLARLQTGDEAGAMLEHIQNDLFDLGADLCRPQGEDDGGKGERKNGALRISDAQVARLEREIDAMNENLDALESFVLPGGTAASAHLHHARTVVRRAERLAVELAAVESVNGQAIAYLNRLSDHLFVMARRLNDGGKKDMLWQPGANR
ncbi:MAG: cob(I)yrinic acid a,c-diamide adenosyltransferase [Alphaproteobacteria bacterium]|jgi:cob(I)alamin adenosyltransferase|nr:cob(I)yrinic acid a,c-diamide adenosyltransferase [Alphaproteobacteria bacterium]MDP6781234.1 cob(I)yrinic acid a,c-diamide adenosyltransferase [Alphaproteobacteria bacterium]MDP7044430.1 cob(I)yrinic acid a,c-diamide adenosyltransferase [Alphaproteobacteria bacterium]|tara:strand:+ start:1014 stop:1595 length:582 start_codon:yes stop_codon:yes gene_type:complete